MNVFVSSIFGLKIFLKLIFVIFILFAFSTKASDFQVIELHKNKSLDQLVLETVNNENDEYSENNSINIENDNNIVEESNIIDHDSTLDNIDEQNENVKNADAQIISIENETFFDLDNLLISIHFEAL